MARNGWRALRHYLSAGALLLAIFVALFRVDFRFEFALPGEREVADPEQEERFRHCVAERDRQIHERTFGTIDNPDVQREVLITEKEKAIAACRELYPETMVTKTQSFRFNLIDVERR